MAGNPILPTENIDEVILGLLALEPNEISELDYQTYSQYLKELLVEITSRRKVSPDEFDLVKNEFKRVKGKKGRFRLVSKKTKVTADKLGLGKIRKKIKGTQQNFLLLPPGGIGSDSKDTAETISDKKSKTNPLLNISNTLDSILSTLTSIYKDNLKKSEKERKDAEGKRREGREKELESKTFEGIKKVASTILKPFESIWQRILKFITMVLLGRTLIKLLNWFADPNNQDKIRSVIRFFTDHWPTLLALYLRFGTGIGRFIGKLGGILAKGTLKLGKLGASLLAKLGLKGAGKFAKVLGGPKARAIATGVGIVADVAVTAGAAMGIGGLASGDIKVPGFSGGGWNSGLKNIFSGAKGFFGNMFNGLVEGPKGRDKVPAMLTDGEFVMSVGAVQKYGVDTLEAMNAAGGGTNVPQISNGVTYAAGGGYVGDIPYYPGQVNDNFMRKFANKYAKILEMPEDEIYKSFKKYGVPSFGDIIGKENYDAFQGGAINDESIKGKEILKKIRNVIKPSSESVRGPISALQNAENILSGEIDYNKSQLRQTGSRLRELNKPQANVRRLALPPAGQSSAARMAARSTIPPSSAIVPYTGGGLVRSGVTGGLSIPQIRTNMKVPGGFGNIKSLGVEMLANYLMDRGFDKVNATIVANKIDEGKKLTGKSKENYIQSLRNIIDREERWQRGFGGLYDAIVGMGKESTSQKKSKNARAILEGIGSGAYQGGAIKGGFGLKQQSFKDMPKTQIMSDDKGRPFVGYKAMRNGKVVYVRGPQPGEGTTNPFEALGRMINPGAYKDIDARNARKKYEEAAAGSISSLKARGTTQANIKKRQEQLKKAVPPLPRPKPTPKFSPAGGGMGGRRGSGSNPSRSNSQKPRSQSPTHSSRSTRTARSTLGINK